MIEPVTRWDRFELQSRPVGVGPGRGRRGTYQDPSVEPGHGVFFVVEHAERVVQARIEQHETTTADDARVSALTGIGERLILGRSDERIVGEHGRWIAESGVVQRAGDLVGPPVVDHEGREQGPAHIAGEQSAVGEEMSGSFQHVVGASVSMRIQYLSSAGTVLIVAAPVGRLEFAGSDGRPRTARVFIPPGPVIATALLLADMAPPTGATGPVDESVDEPGDVPGDVPGDESVDGPVDRPVDLMARTAVILARQGVTAVVSDGRPLDLADVLAVVAEIGIAGDLGVAAVIASGNAAAVAVEAAARLHAMRAVAVVVGDDEVVGDDSVVADARRRAQAPSSSPPSSRSSSSASWALLAVPVADTAVRDPRTRQRVAESVASWIVDRLIDAVDPSPLEDHPGGSDEVLLAESGYGRFHTHIVTARHTFVADEPVAFGGSDIGPSPYDLLAAALGACTTMTLRMYADRKGLALDRITVRVAHDKVHADDASGDAPASVTGRIDRFTRSITLEGHVDPAVRERLLAIADRCPVHLTLERSSRIETVLVGSAEADRR